MKQLDTVAYCHSLFYGTEAAEELAKELVEGTGGVMGKVFVVSSGRYLVPLGYLGVGEGTRRPRWKMKHC